MIKKNHIFLAFWIAIIVVLLVFSIKFKTSDDAIVAVVEPQRVVISFPKPVKLEKINVVPGQKVNQGDTLFIADRPNLLLDIENNHKSLNSAEVEMGNLKIKAQSELSITRIEKRNKLNEIDKDINQIQSQIDFNKRRMQQLKSLSDKDIKEDPADSPAVLRLKALKEERVHTVSYYELIFEQIDARRKAETALLNFKIDQFKRELVVLLEEQRQLIQLAKYSGTVGNVYVQTDEIVAPYTNIVSVYENNPNVIKAFLNEDNKYPVKVGAQVSIESSNREYRVEGEIIEIGSRIIDYPDRLLSFREQELWGQEIFIRISGESDFLNGEKVYVSVRDN